jgi:hypothetical protein
MMHRSGVTARLRPGRSRWRRCRLRRHAACRTAPGCVLSFRTCLITWVRCHAESSALSNTHFYALTCMLIHALRLGRNSPRCVGRRCQCPQGRSQIADYCHGGLLADSGTEASRLYVLRAWPPHGSSAPSSFHVTAAGSDLELLGGRDFGRRDGPGPSTAEPPAAACNAAPEQGHTATGVIVTAVISRSLAPACLVRDRARWCDALGRSRRVGRFGRQEARIARPRLVHLSPRVSGRRDRRRIRC